MTIFISHQIQVQRIVKDLSGLYSSLANILSTAGIHKRYLNVKHTCTVDLEMTDAREDLRVVFCYFFKGLRIYIQMPRS